MSKAKIINITDLNHHEKMALIMLQGGVIGSLWGHHLYFLACNAHNQKAVKRLNQIKNRPENQVLASPGGVEEALEYSDLEKNSGLVYAAGKMDKTPAEYLKYLYSQFPLAIELWANDNAPSTVSHNLEQGKTIWIVGHNADPYYDSFLKTIREFRKIGYNLTFAGTSMNKSGENTLTVLDYDLLIEQFADLVDAISIHPKNGKITEIKYGTSSSAVSFIDKTPKLLRLGATPIEELQKFIPDLQIPENFATTVKPEAVENQVEIIIEEPSTKNLPSLNFFSKFSSLFKK